MYLFIIGLIVLTILDVPWILIVMRPRYDAVVFLIQKSRKMKVRQEAAILAYIMMGVLLRLCLHKNMVWWENFMVGMLTYGIYAMTVAAIFEQFPYGLALLDTVWGGVLFCCSGYLSNAIHQLVISKAKTAV